MSATYTTSATPLHALWAAAYGPCYPSTPPSSLSKVRVSGLWFRVSLAAVSHGVVGSWRPNEPHNKTWNDVFRV